MLLSSGRRRPRKVLSVALAASAAVLGLVAVAPAASADSGGTLTVVGTSDVYDSNLVQSVIQPGFEAAYPDVTLNYVSKGTGAAISYAEAGSASALLVHAESLENQFVAGGYSLEKAGRAVFYGDYVLAGHPEDPASVLAKDPHDIAGAFERIAAAGANGDAVFVSRGGTPGTTVQEHQIWGLVEAAQGGITGPVPLCAVSSANGGGYSPATNANSDGSCPSSITYPSWYQVTGLTQGPNVENADACNYSGFNSDSCYVFTDRGTFEYLQSQKEISDLELVTRDNAASAPGGSNELINTFHAYGVSTTNFTGATAAGINTTAAKEFLTWITSPAAQQAIGAYLASNPLGAPFLPDAHPEIATSSLPTSVASGKTLTVTGTLTNVAPGTPALAGKPVELHMTPAADPSAAKVVATATTSSTGTFRFSYVPTAQGTYTVSSGDITQLERPDLSPTFSDLLEGTSTPSLGTVRVAADLHLRKAKPGKGQFTGAVSFSPKDAYRDGTLQLYAVRTKSTKHGALRFVAALPVKIGASSLSFRFYLPAGRWAYQLRYENSGVVTSASTAVHTVRIR